MRTHHRNAITSSQRIAAPQDRESVLHDTRCQTTPACVNGANRPAFINGHQDRNAIRRHDADIHPRLSADHRIRFRKRQPTLLIDEGNVDPMDLMGTDGCRRETRVLYGQFVFDPSLG